MRILLVLLFAGIASSAKILGFFVIPSISHQSVYRMLMLQLSKNGHNVTIVTPNPFGIASDNYTEIDIGFTYKRWRDTFKTFKPSIIPEWDMISYYDFFNELMDEEFSHPSVQRMLRDERYDLVLVENLITPAVSALSYHYNAPFIGVSSLDITASYHNEIGNPFNPSYFPDILMPYSDRRDFLARLRCTLAYIFWIVSYKWYLVPMQDVVAKKHFGPDTPYIGDIDRNVSLVLANTDVALSYSYPTVPNYIRFGGGKPVHMAEPKPLPQDLKDFLDSATDGVIYFSLGSNVKSETMPVSKRMAFINAFKQVKQKVLWKWEADVLPGQPENVKIGKWFPQTDILAHPNVKAFVTQGGLQSLGEATYNKVPMVVVPVFGDQEWNANKLVSVGAAVRVYYNDVSVDTFLYALKEVLYNKKYKDKITEYSNLIQDQQHEPLEKAVWWVEYVLRHNGARHLRSAAVDMPWYQYYLLDVILTILTILASILYIIIMIIKRLLMKGTKPKKD